MLLMRSCIRLFGLEKRTTAKHFSIGIVLVDYDDGGKDVSFDSIEPG